MGGRIITFFLRGIDLVVSIIGGGVFLLGISMAAVLGRVLVKRHKSPRRILYLISGSIEAQRNRDGLKSVEHGVLSDFEGFFEEVHIVYFLTRRRQCMTLSQGKYLLDFCVDTLERLEAIDFHLTKILLNELAFLWTMYRYIKKHRITVLEATDPYIQGLNGLMLSWLTGGAFIVWVMSDFDFAYRMKGKLAFEFFRFRLIEKIVERLVFRLADGVIADRQYYKDYALANRARPDRTYHCHAMVDDCFYASCRVHGDDMWTLKLRGQKLLLYVGRLATEKYPEDLIKCLAIIRKEEKKAVLLFAGDGPERNNIVRLAGILGVTDSIRFLGAVPVVHLPSLYRSANVVLGTHMGFTLLEASLCGAPIVAYDWEWHPEIIRDGYTGFLVSFGDVHAMAAASLRILKDPGLGRRLGRSAKTFVLKSYKKSRSMKEFQRVYSRILGGE